MTTVAAMLLNNVWDSYQAKHIHGKVDINESGKVPECIAKKSAADNPPPKKSHIYRSQEVKYPHF